MHTDHQKRLELGQRIKALRQQYHIPQEALAHHTGCTRQYMSLLEKGRSFPNPYLLYAIAQGLGCRPERLLGLPLLKEGHPIIHTLHDPELSDAWLNRLPPNARYIQAEVARLFGVRSETIRTYAERHHLGQKLSRNRRTFGVEDLRKIVQLRRQPRQGRTKTIPTPKPPPEPINPQGEYDVPRAARILGRSLVWVYRKVKLHSVGHTNSSGRLRFNGYELLKLKNLIQRPSKNSIYAQKIPLSTPAA